MADIVVNVSISSTLFFGKNDLSPTVCPLQLIDAMTALSTGTVSAVAPQAARLRSSVSGVIFTALMVAIVLTVSALRRNPACTPLSWYLITGSPHLGLAVHSLDSRATATSYPRSLQSFK